MVDPCDLSGILANLRGLTSGGLSCPAPDNCSVFEVSKVEYKPGRYNQQNPVMWPGRYRSGRTMMIAAPEDITQQDYELFRKLVYTHSGINLGDGKINLVRSRLAKVVRQGNFRSFGDYYRCVEQDPTGERLCELLDAITTNATQLFRESQHFSFLQNSIEHLANDLDWRKQHSTLRIWSAACSSGEESHSLAMVAHETLSGYPGIKLKILATDLSTRMLSRAKLAMYKPYRTETVPQELKDKYLQPIEQNGKAYLQLIPELRKTISYMRFNLMSLTFPFTQPFHVIFCRNVMIYFDRSTQEILVNKLAAQIEPGGYLIIGHSESLAGLSHPLTYVESTVYQKR